MVQRFRLLNQICIQKWVRKLENEVMLTLGILNFMLWIFDASVCKYCNCKSKLDRKISMKVVIEISRDFIFSIFGLFFEDESEVEISKIELLEFNRN